MAVELRLFRYAVAVADEASFTRAAERLGIAQPPLSQQIRALEGNLGFRLFERGPGGVKLTPAGEAFVKQARVVLHQADEAISRARAASAGRVGKLALGLSGASMFSYLPPLLRDYRRAWPEVELELRNLTPDEQLTMLSEGRLDAGFGRRVAVPTGYSLEPVHAEPFVAALPLTHGLAKRKVIDLDDLKGDPFVLFPNEGSGFHAEVLALCRGAGFVPEVVQTIAPMHAVIGLVGAGLGVSVVPASVRALAFNDVRYVTLRGLSNASEQFLVYDPKRMSAVASRFVEFTRKHVLATASSSRSAGYARTIILTAR